MVERASSRRKERLVSRDLVRDEVRVSHAELTEPAVCLRMHRGHLQIRRGSVGPRRARERSIRSMRRWHDVVVLLRR